MKLELERLELAFQFVFLFDSSGSAAAVEASSIVRQRLEARRREVLSCLDSWCASANNRVGGVHGDSDAIVADLVARITDSLRSSVKKVFEFESDRGSGFSGKDNSGEGGFEAWESPVRDAYSRSLRDRLTPAAAREAMDPLWRCVCEIFDEADESVAQAVEMAREAMQRAPETDRVTAALAPTWPAHRQAATDRAILRLGRSEIIAGRSPPKWVVHHGVNLAKRYSTEKSPAFVNALLDKILRQVTAPAAADPPASESVADAVVPGADDPTPPPT
ncbi:MAG: hypothetical protein KF787_03840 [Phycisphaeraceae bacterium]|nr:hypothetical protein [Phycisphaerae bacterium]MBX3391760.1 hypothetical protein [Phycisphaeraceae bacterium]